MKFKIGLVSLCSVLALVCGDCVYAESFLDDDYIPVENMTQKERLLYENQKLRQRFQKNQEETFLKQKRAEDFEIFNDDVDKKLTKKRLYSDVVKGIKASSEEVTPTKIKEESVKDSVVSKGIKQFSKKFSDVVQETDRKLCKFTTSSEYDEDHKVANAFDGDAQTRWASKERGEQWIQVRLPNSVACNEARITSRGDTEGYFINQAPRDFEIMGSGDGVNWVSLCKEEGVKWENTSGETKSFPFANKTAYRYYRLVITADNEPDEKDQKNYSISKFEIGQVI